MKQKIKGYEKHIAGVLVVAFILAAGFFAFSSGSENKQEPSKLDSFAQCLSDEGATMYGLETCPHCQNQKDMFGNSFQYVDYVECSVQKQKCSNAGVSGVPAWIIDGQMHTGTQSLQKLASLTECELPENY